MVTAFAARAERAAELVRRGAVEAVEQGRYRVLSAGGAAYFSVREGYCNCPDFAWRGVVPCKHLIAVEFNLDLHARFQLREFGFLVFPFHGLHKLRFPVHVND